ncbi:MAG: type II toxin-antitoxin system RelE/ParE family toxin [Acidobacteriaceae bacterium]
MIQSFADGEIQTLFLTGRSRGFAGIARMALRKLDVLDSAKRLEDLKIPNGNRLEMLKGDRAGQHSIRINDRYRICFRWQNGQSWDVEIVDYH